MTFAKGTSVLVASAVLLASCAPRQKAGKAGEEPAAAPAPAATRPVVSGRMTPRDAAVAFVEAVRSGDAARASLMASDPDAAGFVEAMARAVGGITKLCDVLKEKFPNERDEVLDMDSAGKWLDQVRRAPVDVLGRDVLVKTDDPLFRIVMRPVGAGWKVDVASSSFSRDENLLALASVPTGEAARATAREAASGSYATASEAREVFERRLDGLFRSGQQPGR